MPQFSVTPDDIDVEFSVYCECGNGLCDQSTGVSDSRGHSVTVELCEKCADKERSRNYSEGYDEGYSKGFENGLKEGRSEE